MIAGGTTSVEDVPKVDLDYAIHEASGYDQKGDFYLFNNIPYAAPPTGDRRFHPPEPPLRRKDDNESSYQGDIPPQAIPIWARGSIEWPYAGGEDCLCLDIKVPRAAWEARAAISKGVPVLVWIYGGGYTAGSKELFGSGAGLLARSETPIIYVAINYRLGVFGFLAGPDYVSEGGTPNLGLLDQRAALEWIQSNISAFGGDPGRVTLIGESAGAGSIYYQITAYGGSAGKSPFSQAILQSPGFYPITSHEVMNRHYHAALRHANCKTLEELKSLSEQRLKEVNLAVVDEAPYGQFLLGPVVDGTFTPDLPGKLLLSGSFDTKIKVMLGQCYNEGCDYVEPVDITSSYLSMYLDRTFHGINQSTKDYITDTLYPAVATSDLEKPIGTGVNSIHYSSKPPYYTTPRARLQRLISDAIYIQHNNAISTALNNNTYNYLMSLEPGKHGTDVPYTFYNEGKEEIPAVPGMAKVKSKELAHALQKYLTNFVIYGDPNGTGESDLPKMRVRGGECVMLNFAETGIEETRDPSAKEQCVWWQKGLFA
ncbi:hypothetical protein LTR64_007905 [Lithohypha guttulata]|uniref:uncharacterized protein n=1 Tax=Lithohypha guttulata TaxID=1690604 RepID=UPI002DE0ACEF|nr:hypothetical protein LTR51_008227 [Lithohypha guttulata]